MFIEVQQGLHYTKLVQQVSLVMVLTRSLILQEHLSDKRADRNQVLLITSLA
jgi:hypothetical protein